MLKKYQFKPGINKEGTSYAEEGGWYNADKVRFRSGRPEKIGGWQKNTNNSFLGTCRSLHSYRDQGQTDYIGVGTHLKYYVLLQLQMVLLRWLLLIHRMEPLQEIQLHLHKLFL